MGVFKDKESHNVSVTSPHLFSVGVKLDIGICSHKLMVFEKLC